MRQRQGLPVKKYGPYVQEHLIDAFGDACSGKHTEAIPVAMLVWITLVKRKAISVETYAELVDLTNEPDLQAAVNRAWAILKEAFGDAILLDYAKDLPVKQKRRVVQKSVR